MTNAFIDAKVAAFMVVVSAGVPSGMGTAAQRLALKTLIEAEAKKLAKALFAAGT